MGGASQRAFCRSCLKRVALRAPVLPRRPGAYLVNHYAQLARSVAKLGKELSALVQ